VLVITGIAASLAGSGLAQALETYTFNQMTVSLIQDADFAMKRVCSELLRAYKPRILSSGNFWYQLTNSETGGWSIDYRVWNVMPPAGSSDGYISTHPYQQYNYYYLLGGMGSYGGEDDFLACRRYDGEPLGTSDKDHLKGAFDILLIMKNPSGPGGDLCFNTTVAFRNNGVPNMPVPR